MEQQPEKRAQFLGGRPVPRRDSVDKVTVCPSITDYLNGLWRPINMESSSGSPVVLGAPLAGVVTRHTAEHIGRDNLFRRYGGNMTTSTRMHGQMDVSVKTIGYSVGVRTIGNSLHGLVREDTPQIDQRFALNEASKTEISGILRRFSNFGVDVETADLAGMVFMLAAATAKYSVSGTLTCAQIRDGVPISITALSVRDRVTTARDTVFIPRHTSMVDVPGLFEAMAATANACGARVVTDVLAINPVNNAPRLVEPEGAELAQACWIGLRALLHLHDISGAGAVAALAATKGFHSVMTVVGHTDEGALMRTVLRKHRYAVPYGGVYVSGMETYAGLPTYRRVHNASQQCAVDGICLATAAAVSVCDPTVSIEGRTYPTVVLSYAGDTEESGSHNEGTAADSRSITSQLASGSGTFSAAYVDELARLFLVSGGSDTAARALGQMFGAIAGSDERHTRHRAVAPFYWIEPTSLYQHIPDTAACRGGFGPMCGTDSHRDMPLAEDLSGHGCHYYNQAIDMTWRSSRTTGIAVHLLRHIRGGAANFKIRQADPELFAFKGHGEAETTREAMSAGEDLADYMWGHASCEIPAPSECMYVGRRIRATIQTAIPGPNFGAEQTHSHTNHDMFGVDATLIRCTSTRPSAVEAGGMVLDGRAVRRARAHAEIALECARSAGSRGPAADAIHAGVSFSEPAAASPGDARAPPVAVLLAPEEAEEAVIEPVARQGPAAPLIALQAPAPARRPPGPTGDGAGVAILAAAAEEIPPGQGGVAPAPPAAAGPDVGQTPGGDGN